MGAKNRWPGREETIVARLAIARALLAEYAKLDTKAQGAVDATVARLAKHPPVSWRAPVLPGLGNPQPGRAGA